MNLRLLEIFCRVYKERSFSRAATELGLTQPTVSVHIKDLEDSLGTPVFNRLGREIEPTEAGRYLYEHSRPLLSLKRNVADKMTAFLNRVEGVLVVGASSVPGEFLLPAVLTAFHAEHPAVRVRLRISDTAETIEDLRHGDIEVGVVGATQQDDDLLFESFAFDELVLVTPASDAWRARSEISLKELKELPLVVREPGSGTRGSLERALARTKTPFDELNVIAELGSTGAIKEAVKHGNCVSFISKLAIGAELESGTLRIARVPDLGSIERVYHTVFSRRRVLSPMSRAFLDYLRRSAAPRPRSGGV
ncbi:MAG TPA: selenium metabolism-associated LysR family transcriptional regulator, partial [Polyangiaceae bacterium]|nr:selenium metabolism-associated LysR family transcriptional regulator [Polyangiaceae bacterium]